MPEILGRRIEYQRPWLSVEATEVDLGPPRGVETFYAVRTRDYAAVVAVTEDGRVPLVRQFRPAVDEWTLELPSGLVDDGETAEEAARRELREETGHEADEFVDLGCFHLDSGRMSTSQRAFFAGNARAVGDPAGEEQDLSLVLVSLKELATLVEQGTFRMAAHLGILAACVVRGFVRL